ncbi:MAG TPA: hypothetical protein VGM77_11195 [Gemmatimonadales bacterium]|jgi:hypothetical protein
MMDVKVVEQMAADTAVMISGLDFLFQRSPVIGLEIERVGLGWVILQELEISGLL